MGKRVGLARTIIGLALSSGIVVDTRLDRDAGRYETAVLRYDGRDEEPVERRVVAARKTAAMAYDDHIQAVRDEYEKLLAADPRPGPFPAPAPEGVEDVRAAFLDLIPRFQAAWRHEMDDTLSRTEAAGVMVAGAISPNNADDTSLLTVIDEIRVWMNT